MSSAPRGFLAAFEGIDGSGKSTQAARAAARLRALGLEVVASREPTDGPVGREIRRLGREGRLDARREMELFLEDRAQHVRERIAPALARGAVVLLDRYYISSIAYQGARGIDPGEIRAANEAFAPKPDLVLLFDLPLEEAFARMEARGVRADHFERRDALARVDAVFRSLAGPEVVRIDAARDIDAVEAQVRDALDAALAAKGMHPGP